MKTIKVEDLKCNELEVLEDGTLRIIEKKGKFIPERNEKFFYIAPYSGIIVYADCTTDKNDNYLIKHNLVFRTEQECQEYKNYLDTLDKYSYEFSDEEWEDTCIGEYYIGYNVRDKCIYKDSNYLIKENKTYFKSEDYIDAFIKEAGEDNIKKFMFDIWE